MIIGVIQARMGSSRLPGKVMADLGGAPLVSRVIDRLARARSVDRVVVATTSSSADDSLSDYCQERGVDVVRGDEFDVLDRYRTVLDQYPDAEIVVRITADCPFVDPDIVDEVVAALQREGADFAANRLPPPMPRTYPVGLDVEAATATALREADSSAVRPDDREHVMPYLYAVPGRFKVALIDLDMDLSHFRWTVDTGEDLEAVRRIWSYLRRDDFGWREVLDVAVAHPEIGAINGTVEQKQGDVVDHRWRR